METSCAGGAGKSWWGMSGWMRGLCVVGERVSGGFGLLYMFRPSHDVFSSLARSLDQWPYQLTGRASQAGPVYSLNRPVKN